MKDFIDSTGQTWAVAFDGLALAELRERAGVDIVQDGLYFIEQREDILTKALLVLCREQINDLKLTDRQFAQRLDGSIQDKAIDAVRGAAELFFRPSRWSEIQSRSQTRKEMDEQYQMLRPMLDLLNRPDMPSAMREAVMAVIGDKISEVTSSQKFEIPPSASGQDANRPNSVGDSLAS